MAMNETYNVKVQRKKGTAGMLRVVDPYASHPVAGKSDYTANCADHHHYLYINATDPEYVYVEKSPIGVDFGYGDVIASSAVGSMLNKLKTHDEAKTAGAPAGKLEGDKITFPAHSLCFFETKHHDFEMQEGDAGILLEITNYVDGIESVSTDKACGPTEYYDLQGVKVASPVPGRLYIQKSQGKAAKVIF